MLDVRRHALAMQIHCLKKTPPGCIGKESISHLHSSHSPSCQGRAAASGRCPVTKSKKKRTTNGFVIRLTLKRRAPLTAMRD
jgi:hypothetical protein